LALSRGVSGFCLRFLNGAALTGQRGVEGASLNVTNITQKRHF